MTDHSNIKLGGPLTAWLIEPAEKLPIGVRDSQISKYQFSLPLSIAAGLNTILISVAVAWRIPTLPFILWAALELTLGLARIAMIIAGRRALQQKRRPPVRLSLGLTLGSAASVGYGMFLCLSSQDWAVAILACLSAAATIGGTCLRCYPMPRLLWSMLALSLGPCVLAALFSGEPILALVALQVPLYAVTMATAAFQVNKTMLRALTAEQVNDRRAHHDTLTGLLNRAGLARALNRRSGTDDRFALLYLDLDRFKSVNDHFGHQAGDELLKSVAERLRTTCRPEDAIARIGGDEFVVLAAASDVAAARAIGERIIAAIADEGFFFSNEAAFVGASIGIACCPDDGRDLGPLLGEADAALYQAKYAGRGHCVVAGTGLQRGPVDDRKPVSYAVAQSRVIQSEAA